MSGDGRRTSGRDDGREDEETKPARRDPHDSKDREDSAKDDDDDEADDDESDDDGGGDEHDDDAKDKGPPLYKRPLFWIIGGVVLVLLIVGGILWWLHARQYESTDDAFVDAHIVRLAPQVAGVLTWVAPADNRHVRPGQLLAVIEPSGPEAQRAQAEAQVAQAVAGVKEAQGRLIATRAQRAQTAADARDPEAQAAKAARDYARYRALVALDRAAAAATQVDAARAQAESAAARALSARRAVRTADANVIVAGKQIEAARAQVSAAQAQVRQTNVTLRDLRLKAPVSGQVVNRMVNVGSYVAPGTQLMAIVPDAIWVTANFKETQLARMALGQHVDIRVDAFPDVAFEGHIDSIQRGAGQAFALLPAQNATGNYVKVVQRVPVRILFDHPRRDSPDPRRYPIGPGMSVSPRVKIR